PAIVRRVGLPFGGREAGAAFFAAGRLVRRDVGVSASDTAPPRAKPRLSAPAADVSRASPDATQQIVQSISRQERAETRSICHTFGQADDAPPPVANAGRKFTVAAGQSPHGGPPVTRF